MHIVVGASGQVGSQLVRELEKRHLAVRAVTRNKNVTFHPQTEVRQADFFHPGQLKEAFRGGTTVFLLTPENPASRDILGETRQIIQHYREAVRAAGIKKLVGLSCVGAHVEGNTGNILMSRMLEQGFEGLEVQQLFIRPSYYYSNWLGFMESIQQAGILPTFFPEDLKIEMNSPLDVAAFTADVMAQEHKEDKRIYELVGPTSYSSREVAEAVSEQLQQKVALQPIPREEWKGALQAAGFTDNTADRLMEMTQAVIDHTAALEKPDRAIKLTTDLRGYLREKLRS